MRQSSERHRARSAALQMLYQWEVGRIEVDQALREYSLVESEGLSSAGRPFAEALVRGTASQLARIDPLIVDQAQHWRIERMLVIDRLILRMAIFEMLESDTPHAVVIDEAIQLARTFSEEPAVKFVNGILDAIGQRLRSEARDPKAAAP